MNMIWHDDNYIQVDTGLIVMQTTIQNNVACALGESPAIVGAKCNEMRFVVSLQVWKLPSVETTPHLLPRIMWRQPPPAVGRSEAPRLQCSVPDATQMMKSAKTKYLGSKLGMQQDCRRA